MSTVKSPGEKKQLSLKLDRRNTYGENAKASRKGIQKGKQRQHMNERRSTGEVLRGLKGNVPEECGKRCRIACKDTDRHQ